METKNLCTIDDLKEILAKLSISIFKNKMPIKEFVIEPVCDGNSNIFWHFVGCHGWRFGLTKEGYFLAQHEDALVSNSDIIYTIRLRYPVSAFAVPLIFNENYDCESIIEKIIKWIMNNKELSYTFALRPNWFTQRRKDEIPKFKFDYKMDCTINADNFALWNSIVQQISPKYSINTVKDTEVAKVYYNTIKDNKKLVKFMLNQYLNVWRKELPIQLVSYTEGDIKAVMVREHKIYLYTYSHYFKERIDYYKETNRPDMVPMRFCHFIADDMYEEFSHEETINNIWKNNFEKAQSIMDDILLVKRDKIRFNNYFYDMEYPDDFDVLVRPLCYLSNDIEYDITKGNRFWLSCDIGSRDLEYFDYGMVSELGTLCKVLDRISPDKEDD